MTTSAKKHKPWQDPTSTCLQEKGSSCMIQYVRAVFLCEIYIYIYIYYIYQCTEGRTYSKMRTTKLTPTITTVAYDSICPFQCE